MRTTRKPKRDYVSINRYMEKVSTNRGKMNYLISVLLIIGIFSLVVGMLLVWNFCEK